MDPLVKAYHWDYTGVRRVIGDGGKDALFTEYRRIIAVQVGRQSPQGFRLYRHPHFNFFKF